MAISFSSAVGNLFNIIGKLGQLLREARTYQSNQNTNFTGTNEAIQQLVSQPDIQSLLGSAYIGNLNSIGDSTGALCQNVGQQIINRFVYQDSPQPNQSLTQLNLLASVQNVILQMQQQGATVLTQTVTATASAFTGTGDGIMVVSVLRPQDGLTQELAFAESIQILCTADSYTGGATAGSERFVASGEGLQSDIFAFDWPNGSGSSSSLTAINGNSDVSNGNLLTNSGFTDWTSNVPDNWTLEVGTAGTNILQESTIVYDAGSSLEIVGDGSNLTTLSQTFSSSTGTTAIMDELTQYAINLFIRRDGVAPAAGVLTVEVVNAANNVAITDEAGTAASFTIDLTALSTSFASYTGTFRTSAVLPTSVKIRLRLSTALTTGRSVFVDRMALGQMVRQYSGGPYIAIFSGATNFVQADYGDVDVTNARGGAGSLSTFQTLCDQLWNMRQNELLLPSSSSPTLSDNLITD